MKTACLIFVLAVINTNPIFAADFLVPGIYRLEAGSNLGAAERMQARPGEMHVEHFEHAIPEAAGVTYAMVSHGAGTPRNKLIFLVDQDYRMDINGANRLCVAYAFPDWNDYSKAQPFCRTNIGAGEAVLKGRDSTFTVTWQPRRAFQRREQVAAERRPTPDEIGACALGVCEPAAYGRGIDHYETTYYADRFKLVTPRDYGDILYLERAVPVFAQADRASPVASLDAERFVAVLASGPDWYEVEHVRQDGSVVHGWIDRDDLFELKWVEQKARTKAFRFRVALRSGDDASEPALPVAIEVLDRRTGRRFQVLRDFVSEGQPADNAFLQVVDANFDGHPDITISGMSGGAGPNSTENVFLFDPVTRRFVYNEALSNLPQISIDTNRHTVQSAQRGSCCSHSAQTFRYIDGKLTLVAEWDESLSADGKWLVTTTGHLENGKLRYRTKRKKAQWN
ncbi:hypothetical protein OR16_24815 [Cupriavidus basilensis OR16]|uniref:FG-GAP repeat protein n=1 Tax=Cupriavidus basilensis OR16 TaxID=1127483 RepID=H1SA44_9BURK|nr:hypothetical protein [Cupriavidus basilensis]EHP40593.1 hypothetical protein OR16_24815 [Cupriavidus basilensis OR16]